MSILTVDDPSSRRSRRVIHSSDVPFGGRRDAARGQAA
jgi:hypothetical protein